MEDEECVWVNGTVEESNVAGQYGEEKRPLYRRNPREEALNGG